MNYSGVFSANKYAEANLAREGMTLVLPFLLIAVIFSGSAYFFPIFLLVLLAIIFWVGTVFLIFFFRDPERVITDNELAIVSPADGKVLSIEKTEENEFLRVPVHKISIFMSPFNVHINRIPLSGTIDYLRYVKGKFLAAYKPESSAENEQMIIGITNPEVKILFKQVSGVLARRIVCYLKIGSQVKRGMKFGLIKFGSRVEMFLPLKVKLQVVNGQQVVGGESIIGVIQHDR